MHFNFVASLIDLCDSCSDLGESLSKSTDSKVSSLVIEKDNGSYKFLKSNENKIYLVILGSIKANGMQLSIKDVPSSLFQVLYDLKAVKKKYPRYRIIGAGHSSGASVLAALCDIYKEIEGYCFNPIGLGKTTRGEEFYSRYDIKDNPPNITVIRTDSDTLSQNFVSPNPERVQIVSSNPKIHPHSIKNFLNTFNADISNLNSIFPTISSISFNPDTGFMLVETIEDISNYNIEGDIATIFYLVYTYPDQFSFTLVPADKENVSGPYQLKVFCPDELEGTVVGNYLWEADWKLKQMDIGYWYDDLTGQHIPISSEMPDFISGFDFYSKEQQERSFIRLWFVTEKVQFDYANGDNGVIIRPGNVKIKVAAKKLLHDPSAEYGFVDTDETHTAFKFSEYISKNFETISKQVPELQKLKQIGLLVSLAEFFRDTLKVPKDMLNLEVLKSRIPRCGDYYPKGKVPRLSRKEERIEGDFLITLNITGGVSMRTQSSEYIQKSELLKYLNRSAECLTPFRITHFDYMKDLIEHKISEDIQINQSSLWAISLFMPQSCYEETCNNMVIFNCNDIDALNSSSVYEQISPYSFEGKLYCPQHHPFRCSRALCQKIIMPGQAYAEIEIGKFHSECLICETCGKPVANKFVIRDGFRHLSCLQLAGSFEVSGNKPLQNPNSPDKIIDDKPQSPQKAQGLKNNGEGLTSSEKPWKYSIHDQSLLNKELSSGVDTQTDKKYSDSSIIPKNQIGVKNPLISSRNEEIKANSKDKVQEIKQKKEENQKNKLGGHSQTGDKNKITKNQPEHFNLKKKGGSVATPRVDNQPVAAFIIKKK